LSTKRVVVTGMAINTPIGDTLEGFLASLVAGRSAITHWKAFDTSGIYSKVGGDLTGYDVDGKLAVLKSSLSPETFQRVRKLVSRVAWSTKLSVLVAADAWRDAGIDGAGLDPRRVGAIIGGHNLNSLYLEQNRQEYAGEPDYIDAMFALHSLDTDHAGSVSEALQAKGPIFTVGAACASGNTALRCAVDEVRHHGMDAVVVVGAVLQFAPIDVHAMALLGAISFQSFNDEPALASRPYDTRREGFVPSHGAAALVIESLDSATRRGARIHAEVLGVESRSDGNHLPQPSEDGQTAVMRAVLEAAGVAPEQIDYVSAHATSTPLGDVTEVRSIRNVFGKHAYSLKVNAPKSMLGHTCWAAPTVESVAAILQMNAGRLHPSINVETLDPEVDLDVCQNGPVNAEINYLMKNSFGFGGINCVSLFKRHGA
jgi:3-oxoacyl-(acyl-carrier-protein) synthase